MATERYSFKVGQFNCLAINDVPEGNCNCFLIDTGEHKVLIETGGGDVDPPPGLLLDRLQAAGISPSEIDVVILSHADIDHSAGLIDDSGKVTFPNARLVLSRAEWVFWSTPTQRTSPKASEVFGEEWARLAETIPRIRLPQVRDKMELIESGTEIVPGIRAIATPGHTPGHQVLAVSSGDERLIFIGDISYEPDLNYDQNGPPNGIGNPVFHAATDVDPTLALLSRDWLFEQAAREGTLLMAYHMPFPGLGYIVQYGTGWGWKPLEV